MKKRNITICVSWPYANNALHIGYVASSLSGDILARYHRMVGDNVVMVSGTDSHGTKFEVKAKQEGCTPKEIVDRYHAKFQETLAQYNFSFDKYSITYSDYHKQKCQEIFKKIYDNGYLYEKQVSRPYCPTCGKFVADTEVEITCPVCGRKTKGDNCECGYVPVEKDFEGGKCLICGGRTEQRTNNVLVFKLTAFRDLLEQVLKNGESIWRANSINETKKYLKDLVDRDFSRELQWGVHIPIKGYEDKVCWCWYEALLGYVTDTMLLGEEQGFDWQKYWKTNVEPETEKIIYACHAKDNIMFHSVLFPAELAATKSNFITDIRMVSSEYLNYKGHKVSKSNQPTDLSFDAKEWADKYDTDSLRYFFAAYGPEKKDIDFDLEIFKSVHNSEVVNKFGNLINRTLKFKGLETLPQGELDGEIKKLVQETYDDVAKLVESLEFKKTAERAMELVVATNKYYDDQKPWVQAKEDEKAFGNTIYNCAYVIANLSNIFELFMPNACKKIREYLELNNEYKWTPIDVKAGVDLTKVQPLFARI